ncbi:MAG: GNAT family N-acetyltransferase [Anaerolineales bacterium]|jgi:mycothiol synthase|nr:GNAT family N-acetyltransferase [Anaerolineales bacterium]
MTTRITELNQINWPGGYTFRPAKRSDAEAIHSLLLEIEAVDQRQWVDTLDERLRDFDDPETNPETDSLLALTPDSQVAGLAWVFSNPEADHDYSAYLWGEVHPAHRGRGLGSALLQWMEARGREILATRPRNVPHYLKHGCLDRLNDRIQLFESHGFTAARSFYQMRRDLSLPIPELPLPEGIRITGWQIEHASEARQVLNLAFRDHWGAAPVSEDAWQLFFGGHPDFRTDLSMMAWADLPDGKQQMVGISLVRVSETENQALNLKEGWVADLAVLREWRRLGIATALLCETMQGFKVAGLETAGLGVDTENLTGALRIYERLGFYPVSRRLTFMKTVQEPQ